MLRIGVALARTVAGFYGTDHMHEGSPHFRVTVLGSGTSAGVPMIGCHCAVCGSDDRHDKRTRPSIVVETGGRTILVDTTPELRLQAVANKIDRVDAVVFTHAHADHIFGLDDVRRYNSLLQAPLPVYGSPETLAALERIFPYAFISKSEPGIFRPELAPQPITGPFTLAGAVWQPIAFPHGRGTVLGFRIGAFAYCTDCSSVPAAARAALQNLDVLIIDALRPRPHPTHLSFGQALDVIAELKPKRAFFTHLSHDVSHEEAQAALPPHVRVCYDGLKIDVAIDGLTA